MSHLPAAMSRATSRSPPEGFCARFALRPLQPFLGLRLAVLGVIRGEQRVVVHVLAGADADLALPLRVGELLIGDRVLLHALLRGVDDARAHRDAVPGAVRAVIGLRHRLLEHGGLDRLRDAGIDRVLQPRHVDGQQHVGRRVRAFGLDALLEAGARRDHVDLDAGVLGEGLEQRLDQLLLAIRIDVDLALWASAGDAAAAMATASMLNEVGPRRIGNLLG